jgi:hypothetical protein
MRHEKVPGSAVAHSPLEFCISTPPCSVAIRRARLVEKTHRSAPAFVSNQPARARAVAPEGGRAPRDQGAAAPFPRLARTLRSNWRDDLRVVPSLRREVPFLRLFCAHKKNDSQRGHLLVGGLQKLQRLAPPAGPHRVITQDKESELQNQVHSRIRTGTALTSNAHLKTPANPCRAAFRKSKRNPLHAKSHTFISTIVEVKVCDWTSGRWQFFLSVDPEINPEHAVKNSNILKNVGIKPVWRLQAGMPWRWVIRFF